MSAVPPIPSPSPARGEGSKSEFLITDHLDIWTSAVETRSTAGRGSSNKLNLYGIKKLRELILELAVRGQLVPQDPADEPASVLLKKIAAEKARLIEAGKLKKQEPLPPIADDERPFELPEGWEWTRLNELFALITDGDHQAPPKVDEGIPFLVIGNLNTGRVLLDGCRFVPHIYYEQLDWGRQPKKTDLLYTVTGSYGIPISVDIDDEFCVQRHVAILKSANSTPSQYLYFLLQSAYAFQYATDVATGIAQKTVPLTGLRRMPIALPPLAEQHRIVAKVNELMSLCDALEQAQESSISDHQRLVENLLAELTETAPREIPSVSPFSKGSALQTGQEVAGGFPPLQKGEQGGFNAWQRIAANFDTLFTTEHSIEQLKQTILQLAVMGKLVPQDPTDEPASVLLAKIAAEKAQLVKAGKLKKEKPLPPIAEDEKPFELPPGWEWCRLIDVGELARGKSKHRPRNDPALYSNGNIPLVQTGDVARANTFIDTYTALYNETGLAQSRLWQKGTMCITIAANIADSGILNFDACFPDSVVGFNPASSDISVKYFEFYIRVMKSRLEDFAPSTAQKNINLDILNQVFVPLPPAKELNRIVAKVDELMALCDRIKAQISAAQTTQLHLADALAMQVTGE